MTGIQKIIKYCAIAFAFVLIVNIVSVIVFGISTISDILYNEVKEEINESSINIRNEINVVNVNLRASSLIIKSGDKFKVETDNKYIDINEYESKLYIAERKHNILDNNNSLIIYIPIDMVFNSFIINTGAGSINIDILNSNKITLNLGAGNVKIDNLNAYDELDIEGGVGKLTINNGTINDLDLKLGVGSSTITSNITGESDIETGIGNLKLNLLGDKTSYKIYSEKGIGNISIDGVSLTKESSYGLGNNTIDIESGIGSVDVNFIVFS